MPTYRPLTSRNPFRATCALLMVLGYLVLGISSAWHAPHFSQALESIDKDRHAQHEVVLGDDCAVCSVKTVPQLGSARCESVLPQVEARAVSLLPALSVRSSAPLAARPRAPPSLLS